MAIDSGLAALDVGDVRVKTHLDQIQTIVSLHPRPGPPEKVYNLEVHGEHVYHVGQSSVLVHNEYLVLYHGTDTKSAESIVSNGLNKLKAQKKAGDGTVWTTTTLSYARRFASVNPASGDPAVVKIVINENLLGILTKRNLVTRTGDVYNFKLGAFKLLNEYANFTK